MPPYLAIVLVGLIAGGLAAWSLASHRRKSQAQKLALERLGFRPCPDQKSWLEKTVMVLENNAGYRYEVREPARLPGEPVYYYVKRRWDADEDATAEEEILFSLKRASTAGLVLVVKPSSIAPGLATRLIADVAAGPWDSQPDDLQRLDLPADLKDSNVVAALGPSGASFYDLVDDRTLSVVKGLGDVGGLFVRFRGAWCAVASPSAQLPFRVDELIARIRPILS